jgi:hypothetical protein
MSSPTLNELEHHVSRSDLRSRDVQGELLGRLQDERTRIAGQHVELCGLLDAASILVRSLAYIDEAGTEEVREIVTRIVRIVSAYTSTVPGVRTIAAPIAKQELPDAGLRNLNEMALGQMLVQLGLVQVEDVERALRHSLTSGKRLGESLVELGSASEADIGQALRLQRALATACASPALKGKRESAVQSILLGEILVHNGKIDRKALAEALNLQRKQGLRLGDALVELGWASWADVAEGLRIQEERGGSSERGSTSTVVHLD